MERVIMGNAEAIWGLSWGYMGGRLGHFVVAGAISEPHKSKFELETKALNPKLYTVAFLFIKPMPI